MIPLPAGGADQSIDVFIQDSASTTGAGKTGLAYNTANLKCYYRRGATGVPTEITLASLADEEAAHTDGGFVEIDATTYPGMYRLDLPDAVCAAGVESGSIILYGASGMAPCPLRFIIGGIVTPTSTGRIPADLQSVLDTEVGSNFAAAVSAYPAIVGTVTGTPSTTVFRITVTQDIANDRLIGMEASVFSSGGVPVGRQTISDSVRVDATTQEITIDVAFASTPSVGDFAVVQ